MNGRAKGLFLAMQYPAEIQGVTNAEFLRAAINARRPAADQISVMDFIKNWTTTSPSWTWMNP